MNFIVTNRIFLKPEYNEEFEQRFKDRAGQINKQSGFVRMEICRPISENTPYVVLTHWQNEAAFNNWVGSDDFKLAHKNPMNKEAFLDGGSLEKFEVIITTDE